MYVYGPVPSRRLGRSLGVSPIPSKTCSYSCVYCQLGRTNHLQVQRRGFFPKESILAEIIENAKDTNPNYITFAGDGEPTLCRDLGWLIRQTKARVPFPVAVITNSSLLHRMDVRQDLAAADVVLPTLDAANETVFKAVNRPHPALDCLAVIEGLKKLRKQVPGQIWLEIMLVKGLNDTEEDFFRLRRIVDQVNPDRVYVMTPIRPPAEPWVLPPHPQTIIKAQSIIGDAVALIGTDSGDFDLDARSDARQAILDVSARQCF